MKKQLPNKIFENILQDEVDFEEEIKREEEVLQNIDTIPTVSEDKPIQ